MSSFESETQLHHPTYDEIDAAIAKARSMRAHAMRDAVRAVWSMVRPAASNGSVHQGNRKTAQA